MQDGKGTALFPACAKWCCATDLCVAARGVPRGNPSPQETVPQNSICVRSYFISIMLPPHFLLPVPHHAKDLPPAGNLPAPQHNLDWSPYQSLAKTLHLPTEGAWRSTDKPGMGRCQSRSVTPARPWGRAAHAT